MEASSVATQNSPTLNTPVVSPPALEVENLSVVYQRSIVALRGVSLHVQEGEIVAILGANGAGKTTFLRAISGLLGFHGGAVTGGSHRLWGRSAERLAPQTIVRRGVAQVMEGRRILAQLTVEENLDLGAISVRNRRETAARKQSLFEQFPQLSERRYSVAGYLSGGEQQMLAIARALMSSPRFIILDEPSLGLAPIIAHQIADIISEIAAEGTTVLLVEQNAAMALSLCSYAYVFQTGKVAKHGTATELLEDEYMQELYLGLAEPAGAGAQTA